MNKSRLSGVVCACVFTLVVSSVNAAVYSIVDLGTLEGNVSEGYDVNNSGQITGYSNNTGQNNRAFLYDGTPMQDLGAFGNYVSYGHGINDSGQVTGYSRYSGAGVGVVGAIFGVLGGYAGRYVATLLFGLSYT